MDKKKRKKSESGGGSGDPLIPMLSEPVPWRVSPEA